MVADYNAIAGCSNFDNGQVTLESRVVLRLVNGEEFEETVNQSHGTPGDPLTREELLGKFHECAEAALSEAQRDRVIELCERLDSLDTLGEIADVIGNIQIRRTTDSLAAK